MILFGLLFGGALAQRDLPLISPVFGSHMVLQRDRPNTFWGWTNPGQRVTVSIGGRHATGTADRTGKWTAKLVPPATGGPYTMLVDGPQRVQLDDILVGDVWICSGQSNMEMGIALVNNAAQEIASADYPEIRLFNVPHATSFSPLQLVGGNWARCSPQTVAQNGWGGFSAVGYFFGRELHKRLHIPVGLVETSWGGTIAEAWTSPRGLQPLHDFDASLKAVQEQAKLGAAPYAERYEAWMEQNDPGTAGHWETPVGTRVGWQPAKGGPSYETNGLETFDGVVWFARTVELPDSATGVDGTITLGSIDDMDTVWINGSRIGATYSVSPARKYKIPASLLRPGQNEIVVRVLDTGGPGGFGASPLTLSFGETTISLDGSWMFVPGVDLRKAKTAPPSFDDNPNVPTVLNNGMIAPLLPLAIKGAIWYQGESNAGRAAQYQRLLPAMISDWRRSWGQGDFPFIIVQLANFAARHPQPVDDDWAELREAQALTAKRVRNAGMAVTIDIGERGDIHPKNKQDVGLRLALSALRVAYGQKLAYAGPTYKSLSFESSRLRIHFDHTEGGLQSKGVLAGFQIAGRDGVFQWADAIIDGSSILVSSPLVPNPVAVRYAWDTDPEATLYNGAGLPAAPFRTDDWPRRK